MPSRRHFLRAAFALALVPTATARALATRRAKHPVPRDGITSAKVLAEGDLPERARASYAAAREFPQVLDGLYCHCDCEERDGLYSLLECFHSKMPLTCGICRGEAEMAGRLARDGKTLEEIRAAVDKRYG